MTKFRDYSMRQHLKQHPKDECRVINRTAYVCDTKPWSKNTKKMFAKLKKDLKK